jgi:HAMP domain-containing protein
MRIGLGFRIIFFSTAIVLLTSSILILLAYNQAHRDLKNSIGRRLEAIATTTALKIDGDLHEQINADARLNDPKKNKDKLTPKDQQALQHFESLRALLERVHLANRLTTDIYTLRPAENTMQFVVMAGGGRYIGHTHQFTPQTRHVLKTGTSTQSDIYFDQHGAWLSAFAPIRDKKGAVVAVLEVDEKLKTFYDELRARIFWPSILAILVLLLGISLSVLFARKLVAHLTYLRDVTEKISLGQMNQPIEIRTNDEVGDLAKALERMRESLRMAMQMLDEGDDD